MNPIRRIIAAVATDDPHPEDFHDWKHATGEEAAEADQTPAWWPTGVTK